MTQKITPFLWFDGELGDALEFYGSVFPDSEVLDTHRTRWRAVHGHVGGWATSSSRA